MGYAVVINYEGRQRKVGHVEDNTLICPRSVKDHLFRHGRDTVELARAQGVSAWGLDCKVCDGLLERGVQWLVIQVGSTRYRVALARMKEDGEVLNMKPHRAQYFLNENEFTKE